MYLKNLLICYYKDLDDHVTLQVHVRVTFQTLNELIELIEYKLLASTYNIFLLSSDTTYLSPLTLLILLLILLFNNKIESLS